MGKTEVNGDNAEPVFEWMKPKIKHFGRFGRVMWNFEKFLIGADGQVKQRWTSLTRPQSLERKILSELKKVEAPKAGL